MINIIRVIYLVGMIFLITRMFKNGGCCGGYRNNDNSSNRSDKHEDL